MGQLDPSVVENAMLREEMESALLGTALRFGVAMRRFEQRRRRCGLDHFCSRLFDEVSLSRSMLLLLADEVSRQSVDARQRDHRRAASGRHYSAA